MVLFLPPAQILNTNSNKLEQNISKKPKRKTITFRLVNYKYLSGLGTTTFSPRKTFRYSDIVELQKRRFSENAAEKMKSETSQPKGKL